MSESFRRALDALIAPDGRLTPAGAVLVAGVAIRRTEAQPPRPTTNAGWLARRFAPGEYEQLERCGGGISPRHRLAEVRRG